MKSRLYASLDESKISDVQADVNDIEVDIQKIENMVIRTLRMIQSLHKPKWWPIASIQTDLVQFNAKIVWKVITGIPNEPWKTYTCLAPTQEIRSIPYQPPPAYINTFDEQNISDIQFDNAQLVYWNRTDQKGTYNEYVLGALPGSQIIIGKNADIYLDQVSIILIGCPGDIVKFQLVTVDSNGVEHPITNVDVQILSPSISQETWVSSDSDGVYTINMIGDWLSIDGSFGSGGVLGKIKVIADPSNQHPIFVGGVFCNSTT